MSRHLDKILANAERHLAPNRAQSPAQLLPLYKKFLKIEEHRLRLRHQAGGGGREIGARRAELVDVLLKQVLSAAMSKANETSDNAPVSLLALGGYGRGELNPFSDVDVMFLHAENDQRVSKEVGQIVEQILYLLWDIGFKVGHSTRSIKEAISQANSDMRTKTAMLEARYISGSAHLAKSFREQFRARCVLGFEKDYIGLRMLDQAARHEKFGNNVYRQEPNVKSGCGGLRDYQNLLWLTYFKEGALTTTHLVGRDWLTGSEQRRIDEAYDFLLRVRTDLHYANGRGTDVLHLNTQELLAQRLGYNARTSVHRGEVFMKDYYEHTRNIFRITERITEQFASGHSSGRLRVLFNFLPRARANITSLGSFSARYGQLHLQRRESFAQTPELMMRAFDVVQENRLDLSPEISDLFTRHLSLVTRTYQYAVGPRQIFKSIISQKGEVGRVLRQMHRVDFLGRYIPEFGQLTCLVQHEFFHRYTADEHTLVCIDKLDALMQTDSRKLLPYRRLFEQLENPLVLYLALLLHDTGRAIRARPHSEGSALFAQRVASRLQLTPQERKSLILLVDHHVTLSNMAQQRNLDDPETIVEFAGLVRHQANLDALMLLTLADGQGTSAESWSDWKELLVWQLYHATTQYLSDRKAFYEENSVQRESLIDNVRSSLPSSYSEEIEAHFDLMPDNYYRAFALEDIVSHLQMFRQFFEQRYQSIPEPLAAVVSWKAFPKQDHTIVSICTWERELLLAKLAGAFASLRINILSADTYMRGDNLVLSVFRVTKLEGSKEKALDLRTKVEELLARAFTETNFAFSIPSKDAVKAGALTRQEVDFPIRISFDNKTHPNYTLIQIEAPDRLGLLYDLLRCLDQDNVHIALSRISTEKGAAIDTFYVADKLTRGKFGDNSRINRLQEKLQQAAMNS